MAQFDEPLCGCLQECCSCLIAFFVPCGAIWLTASSVEKATGQGCCMPFVLNCILCCIGGAMSRGKIRDKYHIDGSFIMDCLLFWFCCPCAATQVYREVNRREGN